MRKFLSRIATLGAGVALATLMLPSGTAAATSSAACNPATSAKVVESSILGVPGNRIWVDSPAPTQLLVCFEIPFGTVGGGVVVVNATPGGTLPSVTLGTDPGACFLELVTMTDPAAVRIAIDIPTSTVCFTLNGQTVTLAFNAGSISGLPTLEVWRDGSFALLDVAACPVEYVNYALANGPDTCMTTSARVI